MPPLAVEFDDRVLLPAAWLDDEPSQVHRVYNPAVVRFRQQLLMAYRVDSSNTQGMKRRIAICALDDSLRIVEDSLTPFSDSIRNGGQHHYDPRFLVYQDRLFIHFNNNFMTRPNQIHLVELDAETLEARAPARLLYLNGPRQVIEKNWMLFEHEGSLFAVYQIAPHVILRLNLAGSGQVECDMLYRSEWDVSVYARRFGALRGGAPPIRQGERYISFFHSPRPLSAFRWVLRYWPIPPEARLPRYAAALQRRLKRPFARVRYYGGVYAFEATPPFRPAWLAPEPVLWPETEAPPRQAQRANPSADGIVYPCGAVAQQTGSWLVSFGVHDERCCLRTIVL